MANLTPRIIGLAQNGFDPVTIGHMLDITFAQVNEGLEGQEVQGGSGAAAGVGAWLNLHADSVGASCEGFLIDPPDGFVGKTTEPRLVLVTTPFKIAPGGVVCEVAFYGSDQLLSPVNAHLTVVNMAATEMIELVTEESTDLKGRGGEVISPTLGDKTGKPGFWWPEYTHEGEDLTVDGQGRVVSAAGGVFVAHGELTFEPGR